MENNTVIQKKNETTKAKRVITNEIDSWDVWPIELKDSLVMAKSNTQVGQRLVYENDLFKVWSIHLPAGESLPFHKHCKRYFWTALSSGKSRSFYDDGHVLEAEYTSGDTIYFGDLNEKNYFIHNLENIGNTTLIFTTVEFLD